MNGDCGVLAITRAKTLCPVPSSLCHMYTGVTVVQRGVQGTETVNHRVTKCSVVTKSTFKVFIGFKIKIGNTIRINCFNIFVYPYIFTIFKAK